MALVVAKMCNNIIYSQFFHLFRSSNLIWCVEHVCHDFSIFPVSHCHCLFHCCPVSLAHNDYKRCSSVEGHFRFSTSAIHHFQIGHYRVIWKLLPQGAYTLKSFSENQWRTGL